jgi:hypothetical protein
MAFEGRESFRILFLDKKNGLIADEVQGSGTVDHTPVYPREVMRRALELSATAIVLVHNHPSGDPTPSTQDIKMTLDIIAVAKSLGVAVHDHIIVGRDGHASLKGMRLIRDNRCKPIVFKYLIGERRRQCWPVATLSQQRGRVTEPSTARGRQMPNADKLQQVRP